MSLIPARTVVYSIDWINILETYEDTGVEMRRRKSNKDRQYNGQKEKNKRTNCHSQYIAQKITDRATRTTLLHRKE